MVTCVARLVVDYVKSLIFLKDSQESEPRARARKVLPRADATRGGKLPLAVAEGRGKGRQEGPLCIPFFFSSSSNKVGYL